MTTHTELLPCPFCGGLAAPVSCEGSDWKGNWGYYVECELCGACGPSFGYSDQGKEISAWNSRAAQASEAAIRQQALNDAIRAVEDAGGDNDDYHADAIRALSTTPAEPVPTPDAMSASVLDAGSAITVPEGYALVPIEPTEAMIAWGHRANGHVRGTYSAMVKHAPPPYSQRNE